MIDRSYRISLIVNTTSEADEDEAQVVERVRRSAFEMLADIVSDDDSLGLLDIEEVLP